ncbi:condensation domain-containing protein [Kribbella speibonae]|uniref:Condensation domain-containing protein n=1 Tax=Kribbella speibonae TaxID=1572660 RepID=A0ABY2A6M1_9ACTN|nr:condensation domain-containing protein [Kribbella speibonae]TCC23725.1 hypothetical protein E0H58_18390 [Kribbella speibonae]
MTFRPTNQPAFRATFMQRRLYDVTERHPDQAMRHVTAAFRFPAPLELDRLRAAVAVLTERHDALRMRFALDDENLLRASDVGFEPADVDRVLSTHSSDGSDDEAARVALRHFNRRNDPPWRVVVSRRPDGDTLIVAIDHLVCDARSLRLILDEFAAVYDGQSPPSASPRPFAGFLEEEVEQDAAAQDEVAYWQARYHEFPKAYSIGLPFATEGRADGLGTPAFEEYALDAGTTARMRERAGASRLSPFGAALTALNLCLAPYADDGAIAITGVLPNRRDGMYDQTVGSFAHTTAYVATKPEGHADFANYATASRAAIIATLRNSRLALFDLIGRLGVGGSLASRYGYGIYLDYLYAALDTSRLTLGEMPGIELRLDSGVNKSLSLWVVERGSEVVLKANFEAERFSRSGVRGFLEQFAGALSGSEERAGRK